MKYLNGTVTESTRKGKYANFSLEGEKLKAKKPSALENPLIRFRASDGEEYFSPLARQDELWGAICTGDKNIALYNTRHTTNISGYITEIEYSDFTSSLVSKGEVIGVSGHLCSGEKFYAGYKGLEYISIIDGNPVIFLGLPSTEGYFEGWVVSEK